jgi:hypothetical protein
MAGLAHSYESIILNVLLQGEEQYFVVLTVERNFSVASNRPRVPFALCSTIRPDDRQEYADCAFSSKGGACDGDTIGVVGLW